jgi:phosphatidylserine decarboxylase
VKNNNLKATARIGTGKHEPTGKYMISPASGRIMSIGTNTSPYTGERTISIFMHLYNKHITVAPLDGVVKRITYEKGNFKPAFLKNSDDNERNVIELRTKYGDIKIVQIAGWVARKIKCEVKEGEKVEKGHRIGKIYFGSRVNVTIPEELEILVQKGDRVRYGKTAIAVHQLLHPFIPRTKKISAF